MRRIDEKISQVYIAVVLLFCCNILLAEETTFLVFNGVVTSSINNNKKIENARVFSISLPNFPVISNKDGQFLLLIPNKENEYLIVQKVGYFPRVIRIIDSSLKLAEIDTIKLMPIDYHARLKIFDVYIDDNLEEIAKTFIVDNAIARISEGRHLYFEMESNPPIINVAILLDSFQTVVKPVQQVKEQDNVYSGYIRILKKDILSLLMKMPNSDFAYKIRKYEYALIEAGSLLLQFEDYKTLIKSMPDLINSKIDTLLSNRDDRIREIIKDEFKNLQKADDFDSTNKVIIMQNIWDGMFENSVELENTMFSATLLLQSFAASSNAIEIAPKSFYTPYDSRLLSCFYFSILTKHNLDLRLNARGLTAGDLLNYGITARYRGLFNDRISGFFSYNVKGPHLTRYYAKDAEAMIGVSYSTCGMNWIALQPSIAYSFGDLGNPQKGRELDGDDLIYFNYYIKPFRESYLAFRVPIILRNENFARFFSVAIDPAIYFSTTHISFLLRFYLSYQTSPLSSIFFNLSVPQLRFNKQDVPTSQAESEMYFQIGAHFSVNQILK